MKEGGTKHIEGKTTFDLFLKKNFGQKNLGQNAKTN